MNFVLYYSGLKYMYSREVRGGKGEEGREGQGKREGEGERGEGRESRLHQNLNQ